MEIKEQTTKNQELKRINQSIIKYNQKMHNVGQYRVTLDDDTKYTLNYKNNKRDLDRMIGKIEYVQAQLLKMADLKDREAMNLEVT